MLAYHVIRKVKGHLYLYEQESFREGKNVRTRSRYIGRVDKITGEISDLPPLPSAGVLDNKIHLREYKISLAALEETYAAFSGHLKRIGVDPKEMPPVKLRYGGKLGFKKRLTSAWVIFLPKGKKGNRTKFHTAFRKALALACLDVIRKQKPEIYHLIKYRFSRSYQHTQNMLNTYLMNTNDYNRRIIAFIFKWRGIYNPTFQNPLEPEDLGLTGKKRKNWRDEFGDLMAEITKRGYLSTQTFWKKKIIEAQNTEKAAMLTYLERKKSLPAFLKLMKWTRKEKKAMKRAVARRQAQEEIQRRLTVLQQIFKFRL